MKKIFMLACAVVTFALSAHAQEGQRGGASAAIVTPAIRLNVESGLVKGAPYSADVVTDSVQTLGDGNRILRHTVARVYRDSEGRTRREADRPNGTSEITISDPVAQTSWVLDTDRHTARQTPGRAALAADAAKALEIKARALQGEMTVFLNGQFQAIALGQPGESRDQSVEEHLPSRIIEGLRVEGTRRTQTIAAGAIGNERPLVLMTEEWTSPDLKVLVLSEHSDPRTGTSTYKLVKVSRAEPSAALFQVPADYTVVTAGRGERGAPPR